MLIFVGKTYQIQTTVNCLSGFTFKLDYMDGYFLVEHHFEVRVLAHFVVYRADTYLLR